MPLVINPATGQILSTSDPTGYYEQGYRDPTDDELAHAERVEQYGGFAEQAQAQAERVIRGVTLGAVEGFGSPEDIRARAEVSEELSPVTSFAADVLPDVGAALVTGGLGGLATGAGRAAARGAVAAGGGAIRAGLAAGRAGGAAALAAESVGSGAVAAGQQAYAEGRSFGDDPAADAENVLVWGGLNFGLGAFALGAARRAGRGARLAGKVDEAAELDDVAKAAEARAAAEGPDLVDDLAATPSGLGDEVADDLAPAPGAAPAPPGTAGAAVRQELDEVADDAVSRAARRSSEADAADLIDDVAGAAPEREADSFGRQRRLYVHRREVMEVAEREMQRDLGAAFGDLREAIGRDRIGEVAKRVSGSADAQAAVAKQVGRRAAEFAGELRAEARAYARQGGKASGLQFAVPGSKQLTRDLMDHASAVAKAKDGRAKFEALNAFKQSLDDYKVSLEAGALNSRSPIQHQKLIPRVEAMAHEIRAALEDSATWGEAGAMQRGLNAVISDQLMPSLRVFEESVLERTHRGYDGIWSTEGWETKIRALLKGDDPGRRRHAAAVLDGMEALGAVRREFGDAKAAAKLEGHAAKLRRTLGLADEVQAATEKMGALGELMGAGGPMGGALAGGLAGGLPGAAVGYALPGMVRGFVMGDLIAAMNRLSGATDAAVARGVDDWIRSSRVRGSGLARGAARALGGKLPKLSPEAARVRDVALRRGVSIGMAQFMGEDRTPQAAFERARDALNDDMRFFEYLGQDLAQLQEAAPEVFMAASAQATTAREFLRAKMPANVAASMVDPEGHTPSRDAIEDWAEYVNVVRDPMSVARNLGALGSAQVETLRTVYPRLHERLLLSVIERIGTAKARGEDLDDRFLLRMGVLFPDADTAGSPVFSRAFATAVRDQIMLEKESEKRGGGGAGGKSGLPPSPLDSIAMGGATFGQGF